MDGLWYLRAVWFTTIPGDNGSTPLYTDMSDPGVLRWLDTVRDKLGKPTVRSVRCVRA